MGGGVACNRGALAWRHASFDPGAMFWQGFVHVRRPIIGPAVGGARLGFAPSADAVNLTPFLTGSEPTLPV